MMTSDDFDFVNIFFEDYSLIDKYQIEQRTFAIENIRTSLWNMSLNNIFVMFSTTEKRIPFGSKLEQNWLAESVKDIPAVVGFEPIYVDESYEKIVANETTDCPINLFKTFYEEILTPYQEFYDEFTKNKQNFIFSLRIHYKCLHLLEAFINLEKFMDKCAGEKKKLVIKFDAINVVLNDYDQIIPQVQRVLLKQLKSEKGFFGNKPIFLTISNKSPDKNVNDKNWVTNQSEYFNQITSNIILDLSHSKIN